MGMLGSVELLPGLWFGRGIVCVHWVGSGFVGVLLGMLLGVVSCPVSLVLIVL